MALLSPKWAPLVSALAITAALGACSPASEADNVAATKTDTSTPEDDPSEIAREMHDQMNEGQAMHDSMKDGSMPHDQMGPAASHGPGMKGMGSKAATDAPPKDKADPMPMNDM
ncbi:hypothetical protein OVY29_24040 [Sphingopyxis sp. SE2]|jgi:hypothetical protein|uniref:Pentapeptide MXKDX repeat protein n=1 Tax=Blastomonas natatoria TaxID=34015 RepID=A0A2V3UQK4_9SPHN|nr:MULTISPECIES: hypothetical protein [Sphingomonadaceae]MCZ8368848.1 hypothetical protein [Porphyrobacter sp.]MDT7531727.1 hypothetical protein [Sphingopyxis sp. SE2]PXW68300.1 hypothetical protein C7451_11823 [Blastomonas natatoria]